MDSKYIEQSDAEISEKMQSCTMNEVKSKFPSLHYGSLTLNK